MKKTAVEMVEDILGQQAMDRKRKERWIAALTSGALGTAAGVATKNIRPMGIPMEALSTGLTGLITADLPQAIWKKPVENANHPRWWREDYSPVEHGLALGAGGGLGVAGGNLLLRSLRSRGMLLPESMGKMRNVLGLSAVLGVPAIAGFNVAKKLLEMRDARRDANG